MYLRHQSRGLNRAAASRSFARAGALPTALLFLALACTQQDAGTGPAEQGPPSTSAPTIEAEPEPEQTDPSATAGASSASGRTVNLAPRVPAGPPPKLDTTISSVELEKIIFDTFGSGRLPLTQATDRVIETLRDAIRPIYVPKYESAQGGDWLNDRDLVIGYDSESGAYAYPIKILNFHEIVNDVIDGVHVLVSYCPLCASAVVYDRELDGQILLFGNTSALYESDMVMYDHESGSYWFQVVGDAIVGPLTGKRLKMLPSMTISWGEWKKLRPDTKVLSARLGLLGGSSGNPYLRDPFVGYSRMVNQGALRVSRDRGEAGRQASGRRGGIRRAGRRGPQGLSAVRRLGLGAERRGGR
jgi:hypothetical protein